MSIQALRERKQEISRASNHLLAEKGDQIWTLQDKATWDGHMADLELVNSQIEAHEKMLAERAEKTFADAHRKTGDSPANAAREGVELFLRKAIKDMTPEEVTKFRNTMSTGTGSQGGYTVQTDVSREFIDLMKDYGGIRRVAQRIVTTMGNDMSFPSTDGRTEVGELVTQNSSANSADATFGTVPVSTYKFGSKIITVPVELLQDSQIDVVGLVQKRMRDRIGRAQNQYFSTGTGSAQPFGLAVAAPVGVTGSTGSTTTVTYASLIAMVESIDYSYQAEGGLRWQTSQTLRKVIRGLTDSNGRPIFLPGYGSIGEKVPDTLLGYELTINNDLPAPGANNKSLAFGLFDRFLVRDAMEVTLFRFDDSAYMSKGQVGFLAWARAGSNLLDTAAVSFYQHSAT